MVSFVLCLIQFHFLNLLESCTELVADQVELCQGADLLISVLPGPMGGCLWWLGEPCSTSEPALSWVSGENTGCSFLCGSQLELLVVPALQLGMLPILYKVCPSCFILFQSPGETGQSPDAYLSLLSLELLWTCILHNASLNHRKGGQFNVLY